MIEKILIEINRLKNELDGYSAREALDYIESYINTLSKQQVEEPINEDLEEAARLYAIPHYMKDIDVNHIEEYPYDSGLEAAFIAGAKWQKEHILRGAVDGFIFQSEDYYPKQLIAYYNGELGTGDKVKIIIVPDKEE